MPIRITLDEVLARKGLKAKQLAEQIGVSQTHLSLFRSGKVRGVRFSTLSKLCMALGCEPGDLIQYDPDPGDLLTVDEE
ncbi:helix-turn-helix transcriptional regulator [Stigmatella sp. ncwal1]|uniref:Helix-turn-helix transcriptional regulator n=1 Tax=Stigmatella ashevillensis TaxID=2995309 RepID=A0ABT5DDT1_9BACT|nr:helix-turn-helix transcriptional regulator [Stigmatella ashevillena]MDC0711839.1 helix-turn-helix transcriptional regulator [Stigmatella ashevillena]